MKRKIRKIFLLVMFNMIYLSSYAWGVPSLKLPFHGGESWVLTCGYGCGFHTAENNGYYSIDLDKSGISENQEPGEPVLASLSGTVTLSGLSGAFGYSVKIDNGSGYVVRVAHLRYAPMVSEGDYVYQGQQLGIMGGTGTNGVKVYSDHVHVQLYYNNTSVVPIPMSGFTEFVSGTSYLSDNYYTTSTNFTFPQANPQGWTTGWDTQAAPESQWNEWRVKVINNPPTTNPGILSPVLSSGIMSKNTTIKIRAKVIGQDQDIYPVLWIRHKDGNWNNRVGIRTITKLDQSFHDYVIDLSTAVGDIPLDVLEVSQFSLELSYGENGDDEYWYLDSVDIYPNTSTPNTSTIDGVGGDVLGDSTPIITDITISGPLSVLEDSRVQYSANAVFDDGSTTNITSSVGWGKDCNYGSINSTGLFKSETVSSDQLCQIKLAYGDISSSFDITIRNTDVVQTPSTSYEFNQSITATYVYPYKPYNYAVKTDSFIEDDEDVYLWLEFNHIDTSVSVKTEIYRPDGILYNTHYFDRTLFPKEVSDDGTRFWVNMVQMNIYDGCDETLQYRKGQWRAETYANNGSGYELVNIKNFNILYDRLGSRWYRDIDNNGYSDDTTLFQCGRPLGYKLLTELTTTSNDCNDNDSIIDEGCNSTKLINIINGPVLVGKIGAQYSVTFYYSDGSQSTTEAEWLHSCEEISLSSSGYLTPLTVRPNQKCKIRLMNESIEYSLDVVIDTIAPEPPTNIGIIQN